MTNENIKATALEVTKRFLEKHELFKSKQNQIVKDLSMIVGSNVTPHMAQGLAVFSMSTFANNMRYKIAYSHANFVPINVIVFILSHSGSKKTSSERMLRKAFGEGYEQLQVDLMATDKEAARRAEIPISKLPKLPFFSKIGTGPGFIKRINEFEKRTIGTPSLIIDEVATEFENNSDISENIQIVSELFDSGELEDKPLKDSTNQANPIYSMGISALMMGSESSMFGDSDALKDFRREFMTKLSRRCFFIYPVHIPNTKMYTDVEMENELSDEDNIPDEMMKEMSRFSKYLVNYRADTADEHGKTRPLELQGDARKVYLYYRRYCSELAESLKPNGQLTQEDEIIYLELANRHWKTLKLAGVFTVFRGSLEINIEDLREAVTFVESTDGYLNSFMNRATELAHEKLATYIRENLQLPTSHDMKKMKLIQRNADIPDLCESANTLISDLGEISSLGNTYSFKLHEDGLVGYSFKSTKINDLKIRAIETQLDNAIEKLDTIDGRKEILARLNMDDTEDDQIIYKLNKFKNKAIKKIRGQLSSGGGFEYIRTKFEDMINMLSEDHSFSSFEYKDGVRLEDNCVGKTNLLVLDIDESDDTMQEVSNSLQEFNHITVTSSDNTQLYKFRLIIKLKHEVELDSGEYRQVVEAFSNEYGLVVDNLPRSQVYFAYKNAKVITNFGQEDLDLDTLEVEYTKHQEEIKRNTPKDESMIWEYRDDLFKKWNRLKDKKGNNHHRELGKMYLYAKDLGATKQTMVNLLEEHARYRSTRPEHLAQLITKIMYDHDIPSKGVNIA